MVMDSGFCGGSGGSVSESFEINADVPSLDFSSWSVAGGRNLEGEFVDKCFVVVPNPPPLPLVPGSGNLVPATTGSVSGLNRDASNAAEVDGCFVPKGYVDPPLFPSDQKTGKLAPVTSSGGESCRDCCDFSDVVLKYISQMLMEEDIEEKNCMFQESSAALQAAEKSLYEAIGKKYPPSPNPQESPSFHQNVHCPEGSHSGNLSDSLFSNCNGGLGCSRGESASNPSHAAGVNLNLSSEHGANSSHATLSSSRIGSVDNVNKNKYAQQLRRVFDGINRPLPGDNHLSLLDKGPGNVENHEINSFQDGVRGRKNAYSDLLDSESGRGTKVSAVYSESNVKPEMFDWVLLCNGGKGESELRESLNNEARRNVEQERQLRRSNSHRRRRKQKGKMNVVDLRTLLIQCAQAVAGDDQRNVFELLRQIRQHSSATGDGMQRLAIYFADGLEARLAGSGTHRYNALIARLASAADILKAYHLYLAVCPFRKLANFFSNMTIMQASEKATGLHIVDFGISYGFQWPSFIQRLSSRPGGPPKLRITGIDLPQPGFKPAGRIEETGYRLANYAARFNVPFEFIAIAQKWETIQVEDIKIESDEVLVVNSLFRFSNLLDETVLLESPRDMVLSMIKKMNPAVFILGIRNGAYGVPFFMTRFREALYHYSSLFDMLDTTVPREIPERMLLEKYLFGRELMNAIACEGLERIERPETYKQCQVRNLRAGFRQLPLNEETMRMAKDRLTSYHKDFVVNEDGHWLVQGWKGRIIYALSSWRPAQ